MTEIQWLECEEVQPMLTFLQHRGSPRKLRLFAVACCRRIWSLLDQRCRHAVQLSERYADGGVARKELAVAAKTLPFDRGPNLSHAASAAINCTCRNAFSAARMVAVFSPAALAAPLWGTDPVRFCQWGEVLKAEQLCLPRILRDIFGPSVFRSSAIDPAWFTLNDQAVANLALAIYEERAFDRIPMLAGALEDAGCSDQVILGHLRAPGPHVRGCWAIDLLLGKK